MANRLLHPYLVGAYVYEIIVDDVVRYVGKGRKYRVLDHFCRARAINSGQPHYGVTNLAVATKLAAAMLAMSDITYEIIVNDLNDTDAFMLERLRIAEYPAGQLWNVGSGFCQIWIDPERRLKLIKKISLGHRIDAYRYRARVTANKQWSEPAFRTKWLAQHRALWDDPVLAAERCSLLKKVWADPVLPAKKSELVKSQWTPERRAAMAENRRQAWADPDFKKKASQNIKAAKGRKKQNAGSGIGLLVDSA